MTLHWNHLRLGTRFTILVAVTVACTAIVVAVGLFQHRSSMLAERRATLSSLVQSASAIPAYFQRLQSQGKLTQDEAQRLARETLRNVRFDKGNYFFVLTTGYDCVLHPVRPDFEGTSQYEMRDSKGFHFSRALVDSAKTKAPQFVHYWFPRPGGTEPAEKLSYGTLFEPWGWIVGAGIYVDDVESEFRQKAMLLLGLLAVVTAISVGLSIVVRRGLMRQIGGEPAEARDIVERVAAGDLDVAIAVRAGDRSSIVAAMSALRERLRGFIAAQDELASKHDAGYVTARIDAAAFSGAYGAIARQINALIDGHERVQQRVIDVMTQYANGDFRTEIEAMPGERAVVKEAIDGVRRNMKSINDDVMALVAAAGRGEFSARGDATHYHHIFRSMIEGLNELMSGNQRALEDLGLVLEALSRGDLTVRARTSYGGMLGELIASANGTVDRLRAIVGQVKQSTESVNVASREIAAGNSDLSGRTEQQAASLQETAASMEQLTATVKQNADSARVANTLAMGAAGVAEQGRTVVGRVVTTMGAINESSKRIVDIIGVIDGIAFQTNILALNAAVEAARAGEQGRGFAVVASEVRSLAQRSAEAAKEIKALISESVENVGAGSALVDEAGQTMAQIVSSVKRVTDIMADITTASQEQSTGIAQVNQAIAQMDEATQQNAALVEQAAAASESLEEQAGCLTGAMAVFRLDSTSVSEADARARSQHAAANDGDGPVPVKPVGRRRGR